MYYPWSYNNFLSLGVAPYVIFTGKVVNNVILLYTILFQILVLF